jgi:hypothetical protein
MDRTPRSDDRPVTSEPRSSSEPWSEVPPELEELLRAEMARKSPSPESRTSYSAPAEAKKSAPTADAAGPTLIGSPDAELAAAPATKAPRRTRTTKAAPAAASAAGESAPEASPAATSPAADKPKPKTTRTRTTKTTATKSSTKASAAAASSDSADEEPAAKKPATRRKPAAKTAPEEG